MSPFICIFTGGGGSANNQLFDPQGVALDSSTGTLYIADSGNNRIMRYLVGASSGTVVAGNNGPGTGNTQLSYPRGVYYCILTNSLIIANSNAHNLVRWVSGASSWVTVAGSSTGVSGNTPLLFNAPRIIAFDLMGNMYVADENNQRIQLFLPGQLNGTTIAGITGTSGSTSRLFNGPCALAIDNHLNLYVADISNHRIQKFIHY